MGANQQLKRELAGVLYRIQSQRLMEAFLDDLLSPREYRDLSKRLQIVKQLDRGVSQRAVAKNLRIGVATVERGARELMDRSGGFRKILDRYYRKRK